MAQQYSTALRNAWLDQWETTIGVSAIIRLRTGAPPADAAAADAGTVIASYNLASDWATNASAGSKSLSGLPLSVAASATGTLGHYRIYNSAGTVCHEQGTISLTGGGGDMTVDNTSVTSGQNVNITGFTKTAPGA